MDKIKILLIDENEASRVYFRDVFWLHGEQDAYEIIFASGFPKAQEFLQHGQTVPDMIFFDLVMHGNIAEREVFAPQVGFELIKKIRSLPQFNSTKIIIFSLPKYFKYWKKAKRLGADYFLKNDQLLKRILIL